MFRKKLCRVAGLSVLLLAACQHHQQQQQQQQPAPADTAPQAELPQPPAPARPETPAAPRPEGKAPAKTAAKPVAWEPVSLPDKPFVPKTPGRRVARVDVPGPYVALTFDDGPSPANTPKILDILKRHGAHATFFVAGENAVHNKAILARAAAEGNEIGAHTYSHIKLTGSGDEKIDSEMSRTNSIIESATGRKPVLMRPPYGATNKRIVDKMYNDYGMTSVLWDVDTQDWRHPGVEVVVRRAVGNARAGSIILVHDIHASTLAAVEDIVVGLQARGFKLVTVSQLLALGGATPAAPATPAAATDTPAPATTPEPFAATPEPGQSEPEQPAPATPAPAPMPEPQSEGRADTNPGSASISVESFSNGSNNE